MAKEVQQRKKFLIIYTALMVLGFGLMFGTIKPRDEFKIDNKQIWASIPIKNEACVNDIYGEPLDAKENYVKVNFYCDRHYYSQNTIATDVLSEMTVRAAIEEVGRINKFTPGNEWACYYEFKKVEDWDMKIENKTTIECLIPGLTIDQLYGKN